MPHHQVDAQYADAQAQQNRGHHPDVEAAAHSEQVLLRIQAHQRPLGIFVGHIGAVQPQGVGHGVDPLAIHSGALYPVEILIFCLLQKDAPLHGADQIIEHSLSHQRHIAAVLFPDSHQVP